MGRKRLGWGVCGSSRRITQAGAKRAGAPSPGHPLWPLAATRGSPTAPLPVLPCSASSEWPFAVGLDPDSRLSLAGVLSSSYVTFGVVPWSYLLLHTLRPYPFPGGSSQWSSPSFPLITVYGFTSLVSVVVRLRDEAPPAGSWSHLTLSVFAFYCHGCENVNVPYFPTLLQFF